MRENKIYKTLMLIILTSLVTFMITIFTMYTYIEGKMTKSNNSFKLENMISMNDKSNLYSYIKKVKSTIDKYYLWCDEIDETKLETSAIEGYVKGLGDEYTEYIPADKMKEYKENIIGNFVGIGIYMIADETSGRVVVYYPIPESPAEKAGIKPGDQIISVNGTEYTSEDFETISDYIKGEEGTTVNLVIKRGEEQIKFDIVRERINTNPISIKIINNNIGYLKLPSFDQGTAEDFKSKVEELVAQGATSLIIDLRNNGGGIVDEATSIADFILEKGNTIITTVDNKGNKETTLSKTEPIIKLPINILVNENSASASEILVCSLKDNGKAKIIGTTTFGKGIIQTLLSLTDGSGLKITTEEYYTPKGTKIHKTGIKPDEEVKLPENITSIFSVKEEEDTQLQKAIELLK